MASSLLACVVPPFAVAVAALASIASAQIQAYTFNGASSGNQCGTSVRNAFDVDGDGFDDIIVGEPNANPNGNNSGRARVYSGKTGAILWTFNGGNAGDQFGSAVAGFEITPGNVVLVVGAPQEDTNLVDSGAVYVYSGATGALLKHLTGPTQDEQLGASVSSAGDTDGDGFVDLIAGTPYLDYPGSHAGGFELISGSTLALFSYGLWHGTAPGELVGWSVAGAGDINHDGYDDIVVGAPGAGPNHEGEVLVLSLSTGLLLYTKTGSVPNSQFGYSVSGSRDVDHDGWSDFIVGAPFDDTNGAASGRVKVFSGHTGTVLHNMTGSPGFHFGQSVSLISDIDGDSDDEFIAGSPYGDHNGTQETGVVRVFSGANGNIIHSFFGDSAGDHLGASVSRGGDINNDGTPDVIAGAPHAAPNGSNSGLARAWFMGCPNPSTYCTAKTNSSGCNPQIDWTGVPTRVTGADDFEITASHVLTAKSGLLFWGLGPLANPFHGGTLCVAAPTVRTPIQDSGCPTCGACQGTYTFAFSHAYMASQSVHAGDTIFAQFWSRDPGFAPPDNYGLTDALQFTVAK
jgi:hypothetical protein